MSISLYDYCIKYNMQHLLEEWDYERNSKTPKEVTSKNAYVAWWKCKKCTRKSKKLYLRRTKW